MYLAYRTKQDSKLEIKNNESIKGSIENSQSSKALPTIGVQSPQESHKKKESYEIQKEEIIKKLKSISKQSNNQYTKMQAIYTQNMDFPKNRKQSQGGSTFEANKIASSKSKPNETKNSPVTNA